MLTYVKPIILHLEPSGENSVTQKVPSSCCVRLIGRGLLKTEYILSSSPVFQFFYKSDLKLNRDSIKPPRRSDFHLVFETPPQNDPNAALRSLKSS